MKKIACIGNATYDMTFYGDKFPEEDKRTNYERMTEGGGGPSSNAASVIKRLGNDVDFYGRIGNDLYGQKLVQIFKEEGINIENLKLKDDLHTPCSSILVNTKNNTRTINAFRDSLDFKNPTIEKDTPFEQGYDAILTDGKYSMDFLELVKKNPQAVTIIDAGRSTEKIINLCQCVDYIICSEDFANGLMKYLKYETVINFGNMKTIDFVMNEMKKFYPNSKIVITVGSEGCLYFDENDNIKHMPAYKIDKVVDTTAAGDIFHGAFTYAFMNGYTYEDSLYFANVTASLSTTKEGGRTSCPNLDVIEAAMGNKIINSNKNKQFVKKY